MVKKEVGAKKIISKKKIFAKPINQKTNTVKKDFASKTKSQTEKILLENFVSLQKVLTHLSLKVDDLTNQISKLLELFEISAKTLAEKDVNTKKENNNNQKIIEKMDNLLEQNRVIARGVAMMHEKDYVREPIMRPSINSSARTFPSEVQNQQSSKFNQLPRS